MHVEHALARLRHVDRKRVRARFLVRRGVPHPHLELVEARPFVHVMERDLARLLVLVERRRGVPNLAAAEPQLDRHHPAADAAARQRDVDVAVPAHHDPRREIRARDGNALLARLGREGLLELERVDRHVERGSLRLGESARVQAVGEQEHRRQRLPLEVLDELTHPAEDVRGVRVEVRRRFVGRQLRLVEVEDAEVVSLARFFHGRRMKEVFDPLRPARLGIVHRIVHAQRVIDQHRDLRTQDRDFFFLLLRLETGRKTPPRKPTSRSPERTASRSLDFSPTHRLQPMSPKTARAARISTGHGSTGLNTRSLMALWRRGGAGGFRRLGRSRPERAADAPLVQPPGLDVGLLALGAMARGQIGHHALRGEGQRRQQQAASARAVPCRGFATARSAG